MTTTQAPPYHPRVKTQEAHNRYALALCKANLHRAPGERSFPTVERVTCIPIELRPGDP
jgi:hypothetical protein